LDLELFAEGKIWSEVAMKRAGRKFALRVFYATCALGFCAVTGGSARAQDAVVAPPPSPPDSGYERMGGHRPMPPDVIEFVGFQAGLSDKVVAGAPFSATITTESKQTLADGNAIQRNSTGTFARDGQGRTRRDMMMPAFGPWADSGKPAPHVASLSDPVGNARYVLDADNKTARKIPGPFEKQAFPREDGPGKPTADSETVTTSLGTQMVGGVSAEGTRYTRTIPAGKIGNAKPIVILTERWYSPELQVVVMTKRTDPRIGETSFQMTNIVRQEPAASLFQVPADYTLRQSGRRRAGRRVLAPAPPAEQ
jgi:hypothetical protein